MNERRILIVEDRPATRRMLEETLQDEGWDTTGIEDGGDAVKRLREESFDLVLTDLELPGKDGLQVLAACRESDPLAPVIVMTAHGTVETAVEAMKRGAYDFLTKPVDTDRLLLLVERAAERRSLELRTRVTEDSARPPIIAGESPAIQKVLRLAEKVAPSDSSVLILGESGTGKELFARYIHSKSRRAKNQLVALNCAAIPRELIESELFGAEKGSYTGADRRRLGKFELANSGTLFFDEIGELERDLQSKLLRVLENRVIERVGGSRSIRVDVRLITATNQSLEQEVSEGRFRDDLYYRLNVFPIHLPPLRFRREDIPILAEHLLAGFSVEMGRPALGLSPKALAALQEYDWPGNVRELRNTLERAVILTEGNEIPAEVIAVGGTHKAAPASVASYSDLHAAVRDSTRRTEIDCISRSLKECDGNKSEVARRLKVSYRSLWAKIKEYELE